MSTLLVDKTAPVLHVAQWKVHLRLGGSPTWLKTLLIRFALSRCETCFLHESAAIAVDPSTMPAWSPVRPLLEQLLLGRCCSLIWAQDQGETRRAFCLTVQEPLLLDHPPAPSVRHRLRLHCHNFCQAGSAARFGFKVKAREGALFASTFRGRCLEIPRQRLRQPPIEASPATTSPVQPGSGRESRQGALFSQRSEPLLLNHLQLPIEACPAPSFPPTLLRPALGSGSGLSIRCAWFLAPLRRSMGGAARSNFFQLRLLLLEIPGSQGHPERCAQPCRCKGMKARKWDVPAGASGSRI